MAIAKIQNIPSQFLPASDKTNSAVQKAKKISVPATATKLSELVEVSPNAEFVLLDFFGACWLRFDGEDVAAENGHKFTGSDHPMFAAQLVRYISIMSASGSPAGAFVSQFSGVC